MKTYPVSDNEKSAHPFAFEIDNAYVSLRKIVSILRATEGVSEVRRRKSFSSPSDIHIRFLFKRKEYVVWELYGDNSRYWIGPDENVDPVDIGDLKAAFDHYRLPVIVKLFGDVITLNIKGLLGRE